MSSSRGRGIATLVAVSVLGVLALWLRSSDLASPPRFLPRCAFFEVTGWFCPGCGNTRAAHALLHGDVAGALRQNAFSVIALPFLLVFAWEAWVAWIAPGRSRRRLFHPRQWQLVFAIAALLAFTILRNLPWAPFSWLAPDPPKVRVSPESEVPTAPLRSDPPPAVP
jgi:hypothetical protein